MGSVLPEHRFTDQFMVGSVPFCHVSREWFRYTRVAGRRSGLPFYWYSLDGKAPLFCLSIASPK